MRPIGLKLGETDEPGLNFPNTSAGRKAYAMKRLTEALPESQGHGTNDPDAIKKAQELWGHAEVFDNPDKIAALRNNTSAAIRTVIEAATTDEQTIKDFNPEGSIRHVSRSADIARELLYLMKLNPELLTRMCIGDVKAPDFLKGALENVFKLATKYHSLIHKREGSGYEVGGKGLEVARELFFKFIDPHYGFSRVSGLTETFTKQSAITNGGMGALSITGSAMIHRAAEKGMHHRFVSPDNSFGTWKNIVELVSKGREKGNKIIGTKQKNLLHMSPEDITDFYEANPVPPEGIMETWCITPASNPGGTKVKPQMLKATIKEVIAHNPNATFIMDSVYIRTLNPEVAQELIGVLLEPEILDKIVWIESFSKSHGVCGEREGVFFAANKELFSRIQNQNMTLFAGPGLYKSALLLALCSSSDKENAAFDKLHQFWATERQGLYNHLMHPNFAHLFEPEQPHILPEQLEDPMGLYVFLKLKPGKSFKEVAVDTHIVGVEEKRMAEGNFIRFSVGTITKPTYGKYVDTEAQKSRSPRKPINRLGQFGMDQMRRAREAITDQIAKLRR